MVQHGYMVVQQGYMAVQQGYMVVQQGYIEVQQGYMAWVVCVGWGGLGVIIMSNLNRVRLGCCWVGVGLGCDNSSLSLLHGLVML